MDPHSADLRTLARDRSLDSEGKGHQSSVKALKLRTDGPGHTVPRESGPKSLHTQPKWNGVRPQVAELTSFVGERVCSIWLSPRLCRFQMAIPGPLLFAVFLGPVGAFHDASLPSFLRELALVQDTQGPNVSKALVSLWS